MNLLTPPIPSFSHPHLSHLLTYPISPPPIPSHVPTPPLPQTTPSHLPPSPPPPPTICLHPLYLNHSIVPATMTLLHSLEHLHIKLNPYQVTRSEFLLLQRRCFHWLP